MAVTRVADHAAVTLQWKEKARFCQHARSALNFHNVHFSLSLLCTLVKKSVELKKLRNSTSWRQIFNFLGLIFNSVWKYCHTEYFF